MLATFVAEVGSELKVVAIGTGTKSLGKSKVDKDGLVLSDCHAEVLARRSLIKSLSKEVAWLDQSSSETSDKCFLLRKSLAGEGGRFKMRDDVKLHMFVTEPPCGDSSLLSSEPSTSGD